MTDDIVARLRRWTIATDAVPASDLMDEAADEIERLRNGAVEGRETVSQATGPAHAAGGTDWPTSGAGPT